MRAATDGEQLADKCVGMAPLTAPGSAQQDLAVAGNARRIAATGASWVRISLDWPQVEPEPGRFAWAALDANVAAARAAGLRVILSTYRFAPWATPERDAPDPLDEHGDARARDAHLRATAADRFAGGARLPAGPLSRALRTRFKQRGFRLPDLDAWSAFAHAVMRRYGARIDAFEPVNEPNLLYWPQPGIERATAQLIAAVPRGRPLLLLGATSEVERGGPLSTPFVPFAVRLAAELDRLGVDRAGTAWSHHAYTELEEQRPLTAQLRAALGRGPVYITEAGVRLQDGIDRARQARLLAAGMRRLRADPGVALVTQFLLRSQIAPPDAGGTFDSGLLDPNGRERPAYAAWRAV